MIQLLPSFLQYPYARFYFDEKKRRMFYRKIAELTKNGLKINDVLKSMLTRKLEMNNNKENTETWIYRAMLQGMSMTGGFSGGIKEFVPSIDYLLINAGESGDLPKVLESAADLNEKMKKIKSLVRKALIYPVFVLTMAVVVTCWLGVTLFPVMEDFVPVSQWSGFSRSVYKFSLFMSDWWPIILAGFGIFCYAIIWTFPRLTGPIRLRLDRIPPWSLYRLSQGGAWIMSITAMVEAGIINSEALRNIHERAEGNPWLQERTKAVSDNLSHGRNMGAALMTRFRFPDLELCYDMSDYAKSANFNAIFQKVGREWIDASVIKVEEQSKLLNGIALMIAMTGVAGVVQSVFQLTGNVMSSMSNMSY